MTVKNVDALGSKVNYTQPIAIDRNGDEVIPVCSPTSGSIFPVGKTRVTCRISLAVSQRWGLTLM